MKRMILLPILVTFSVLALAACSSGGNGDGNAVPTAGTYTDVLPDKALEMIEDIPNLIVIDVSPVYDQGHLPGAVNYYLGGGELDEAIPMLDKTVPYLVYCHSDSVSIAGAELLIDSGFETVYRLEGNYAAWEAADYQIGITPTTDWEADGSIVSGEYSASRVLNNDYKLFWRMDAEHIYLGMKADTDGWVAIGFDPRSRMDEADIILGFVEDGQTTVTDSIATAPISSHPLDTNEGGTDDVIEFAGSETGGFTTIEFKRLLSTGDSEDKNLGDGKLKIIWAYSSSDNDSQRHADRGTSSILLGKF